MLNEKVCFSSKVITNDREYCQNTSELFNSATLYILLERFSNTIIKEIPEYGDFLNRYFNDEGYIDIWRIPYLLSDLINENSSSHELLLNDEAFTTQFMSFIGEFYNYCMKNTNLFLIQKNSFTDFKSNMYHIRKNQCLYNLIAETYCKIYDKLNSSGGTKIA
ncbi:hypothetical protein [Petroclostridium sp. X23]|uniref:hypothetical protein n=1 Tax=Petroclostridium sp. X23 TaxID=3045146 RepID=UPI0024AD16F8|nr:hypothetical protein [Petroclostridium sp. X23]WHH60132.1 hypothetical protein QKW49_05190 [Petroclostridium sp. X23]